MMNVTVYDHASAAYVSEMEYAASMHFSAAHLPSGTSSSLTAEERPSSTSNTAVRKPQYVQQRQEHFA